MRTCCVPACLPSPSPYQLCQAVLLLFFGHAAAVCTAAWLPPVACRDVVAMRKARRRARLLWPGCVEAQQAQALQFCLNGVCLLGGSAVRQLEGWQSPTMSWGEAFPFINGAARDALSQRCAPYYIFQCLCLQAQSWLVAVGPRFLPNVYHRIAHLYAPSCLGGAHPSCSDLLKGARAEGAELLPKRGASKGACFAVLAVSFAGRSQLTLSGLTT